MEYMNCVNMYNSICYNNLLGRFILFCILYYRRVL